MCAMRWEDQKRAKGGDLPINKDELRKKKRASYRDLRRRCEPLGKCRIHAL